MKPILHILFDRSAASILATALNSVGRSDSIIALSDDLSFGPIKPLETEARFNWVQEILNDKKYELDETENFWKQSRSNSIHRIVWFSKRVACEYAGFLEWVRRFGDLQFRIVNMSSIIVPRTGERDATLRMRLPASLSLLTPDQVANYRLFELSKPPLQVDINKYRVLWNRLRDENAQLRVLNGMKLHSAPISFFDNDLLSNVSMDWQESARVVGETMVSFFQRSIYQTDELLLFSRIAILAQSGLIDIRGRLDDIRSAEVRLPKGAVAISVGSGSRRSPPLPLPLR